jgi:hypothetical protein
MMAEDMGYEAYILYRIGKPQLMDVFKTLELARAACQEHYEQACFTTKKLNWGRNSMAHVEDAYSYMVQVIDTHTPRTPQTAHEDSR